MLGHTAELGKRTNQRSTLKQARCYPVYHSRQMTTKNNNDLFLYKRNVVYKYLVGGVNPSEKYESQLG